MKKIFFLSFLYPLLTTKKYSRATKILSNRFLLLFLLLISLSSCDWDAVIFYYDGTPQGTVATDNYITSVSYIYEGRDGTNYGPSSSKPINIGKYKVSASGTGINPNNGMTESFGPGTGHGVQSTNFVIVPANSRISASITIDQAWVDANSTGPWTISASSVTVTFGENLTITNTDQYFIITGSNVTIDGAGKTATISGVTNFLGLVNASGLNGSSAIIKNIGVEAINSTTLAVHGGYISRANNYATIIYCSSTGEISSEFSGGIAGNTNFGNISNCHSSGNINGLRSGGIAGYDNRGNISKCYSTGPISGVQAGGIAGENNQGNISNCYTSGNISGGGAGGIAAYRGSGAILNCYTSGSISGQYSGGIAGNYYSGAISNCYSTGPISGVQAGGIAGENNQGNISNCYTSGSISGQYSGGIAGNYYSGAISNCRSSGTLTTGISADIIAGIPSTGTISNSINVTPTNPNTWYNLIANQALIELGTIWDQSSTPYTLFPTSILSLSNPVGTLTYCMGTSSTPTTFNITGSYLTSSVTITAPSNFEISESEAGAYLPSLTLSNTVTISQTLYVRLASTANVGVQSGTISATSTGASDVTTTISGTVNAIPSISITETEESGISNNDGVICNGASVTLTASGTTTFLWSTSTTSPTITLSPTTNTIYTVTGTTSGCSNTASITITVNLIPSITIAETDVSGNTNDGIICIGASATLTASGGDTYLWSTSTASSTITLSPTINTRYTVTGTTSGCINTASTTVTVNSYPILSTSAVSICKEGAILITVNTTSPVEYGWSVTGANTVNKNGYITAGTMQGNYAVSYTDGGFCTSSATVTVINPSASSVAAVTGVEASYKFDGTTKGPAANIFMGYNGYDYGSQTNPINPGFYKANKVDGNNAGCPYAFYIFSCTSCVN